MTAGQRFGIEVSNACTGRCDKKPTRRKLLQVDCRSLMDGVRTSNNARCLIPIPFNEVRSGRGHESFSPGILGTRDLVHYLFRRSLHSIVFNSRERVTEKVSGTILFGTRGFLGRF
jgi:hypothetical protein